MLGAFQQPSLIATSAKADLDELIVYSNDPFPAKYACNLPFSPIEDLYNLNIHASFSPLMATLLVVALNVLVVAFSGNCSS